MVTLYQKTQTITIHTSMLMQKSSQLHHQEIKIHRVTTLQMLSNSLTIPRCVLAILAILPYTRKAQTTDQCYQYTVNVSAERSQRYNKQRFLQNDPQQSLRNTDIDRNLKLANNSFP